MKVLILGVGMQGRTALHDLASGGVFDGVVAADLDVGGLEDYVRSAGLRNVTCERFDARDAGAIDRLMGSGVKAAVDLLPVGFLEPAARAAIKHGVHLVNTNYLPPAIAGLAAEAEKAGVAILPEFGLDPGIDLVLLGEACRRLDEVTEIRCYGAGIPEPEAAGNVLKYKISWTYEGVLASYRREARLLRDGKPVTVPADRLFDPEQIHEIEVEGLGRLEAFPNGDAVKYGGALGAGETVRFMGRYSCRWPGYCAFWRKMVGLGFLDEKPVDVDGTPVSPRRFVVSLLEPQLRYGRGERDVAFLRVEARGRKDGADARVRFEVVDRKDLETGFSAMNRTVGFTASIGAQMLAGGTMAKRGVLSPIRDVPFEGFVKELYRRGVRVTLST
ncbi:MAG: saccharopine dehydrogenase family protein [Planctomycetota bacterium]|jgi:saccharopine dehydrogenase-like NADP-dependent oxidoreductase